MITNGRDNGNSNKIIWYLAGPRKLKLPGIDGIRDFTYKKTIVPSLYWRTPDAKRAAWDVYYKNEFVVTCMTLAEVKAFIKEKLDN